MCCFLPSSNWVHSPGMIWPPFLWSSLLWWLGCVQLDQPLVYVVSIECSSDCVDNAVHSVLICLVISKVSNQERYVHVVVQPAGMPSLPLSYCPKFLSVCSTLCQRCEATRSCSWQGSYVSLTSASRAGARIRRFQWPHWQDSLPHIWEKRTRLSPASCLCKGIVFVGKLKCWLGSELSCHWQCVLYRHYIVLSNLCRFAVTEPTFTWPPVNYTAAQIIFEERFE